MRYCSNGENEGFERDETGSQLIGGTVRPQSGFCIHVADASGLLRLLKDVAALPRLRDVPFGHLDQRTGLSVHVVQLPSPYTVSRGRISGSFPGAHGEFGCLSG